MNVLTVNLLLNTLIFWIAARLYLLPRLERVDPTTVLVPILLLHSTRHLGLMFLASGATHPGIPAQFSYPAAFGDLAAAVFALVALFAVKRNLRGARAAVWVFNVAGTLDLLLAITVATKNSISHSTYKDSPVSVHALSLSPQAVSGSSVNWLKAIAVGLQPRHETRILDLRSLRAFKE